ncbi:uncharacterized protein PRCAT00001315001 [Priceomyces carsonii]|uniref:uncharacterized protein n=1 Tax=Priceomyces carsonii TaxID=28549 RepID=UPI002ED8D382|nr:unnamed protein product [Priceomyces carsonii]
MTLTEGDTFPKGVEFNYIPIDIEIRKQDPLSCSRPIKLFLDKLFEKHLSENILFVAVPGAFTPTCTENHIPPFLDHLNTLKKDKDIGAVVILSTNDAFVLNAWGKLLLEPVDLSGDLPELIFASDPNASFSKEYGLFNDATASGMGIRSARYAMLVDSSRKIKYLGREVERGVKYSGYDAILNAKL